MAVAVQREYGFFLAKAQFRHLFNDLDLRLMGMFKVITPTGLVGPDDPPGVGDIDFLNAGDQDNVNNNASV